MLNELTNKKFDAVLTITSEARSDQEGVAWVEPEALKILVLEDTPEDRILIERTLSKIEGFEIEDHYACNLSEALDLAFKYDFDVALLDFLVNGECGPELIPELAKRSPQCAMILLTGQLNATVHHHALNNGTIASLSKDDLAATQLEFLIRHSLHANHAMLELKACKAQLSKERDRVSALSALSSVLPQYLISSLDELIDHTAKIENGLAGDVASQNMTRHARATRYLADDIGTYCRDILDHVEGRYSAEAFGQMFDLQSVVLDVSHIVEAGSRNRSVDFDVRYLDAPVHIFASERILRHALVVLVGAILDILPVGSRLVANFVTGAEASRLVLTSENTADAELLKDGSQALKTLKSLLAPLGVIIDVSDRSDLEKNVIAQVQFASAQQHGTANDATITSPNHLTDRKPAEVTADA